ncbi:hypothetical protein [Robinsoniella sp. KNHs210]|uniref:hypothetical protein n=1 Tax=Robinsoniella sp. KNHs210 TaxID=1469950 RepID=UPI0004856543|nr:hypothetical protein [Robinsoniella sp. KNHs210]
MNVESLDVTRVRNYDTYENLFRQIMLPEYAGEAENNLRNTMETELYHQDAVKENIRFQVCVDAEKVRAKVPIEFLFCIYTSEETGSISESDIFYVSFTLN